MINKRKQYCLLIFVLVLAVTVLSGCLKGRGDWSYELTGGYAIDRVNAHGIALVHRQEGDTSGAYVIENFFVTDFCSNQGFIGLKGFATADIFATDAEMKSAGRIFYLVEVASGTVHGPYDDQDAFDQKCRSVSSRELGIWRATADITGQEAAK